MLKIFIFILASGPALSFAKPVFYSQQKRMKTIRNLGESIERKYALIDIKKVRLGIDTEKEIQEAAEREQSIPDSSITDVPKANLDFLDRLRFFAARFHDSHFAIFPVSETTPLTLGIRFLQIDKRFFVSSISTKVMAYNDSFSEDKNFSAIEVGDEVLGYGSTDDQLNAQAPSPENEVKRIIPYIRASSTAFARLEAVYSLTERNFFLPEKNFVDVTIKHQKNSLVQTYRFYWYVPNKVRREDERVYLDQRNMNHPFPFSLVWNQEKKIFDSLDLDWKGHDFDNSFMTGEVADSRFYSFDNRLSLAVRFGYGFKNQRGFAFLQIFSFSKPKVYDDKGKEQDLAELVQQFLVGVKYRKVPLILDLRSNEGGDFGLLRKVESMFVPPGGVAATNTFAYRINDFVRDFVSTTVNLEDPDARLESDMSDARINEAAKDAIDRDEKMSAAITTGILLPNTSIAGFDVPVVALTTSRCISSCDLFAKFLQLNHLATLVGQPTNGTGAGYDTHGGFRADSIDSGEIAIALIPNILFGEVGINLYQKLYSDQAIVLNSENRPVVPDYAYSTSTDDLINYDQGWMQAALDHF